MTTAIDYFNEYESGGEAVLVGKAQMVFLWLSKEGEKIILCDFEGAGDTDVSEAEVEELLLGWLNTVGADPSTVHDIPHFSVQFKEGRFKIID